MKISFYPTFPATCEERTDFSILTRGQKCFRSQRFHQKTARNRFLFSALQEEFFATPFAQKYSEDFQPETFFPILFLSHNCVSNYKISAPNLLQRVIVLVLGVFFAEVVLLFRYPPEIWHCELKISS